MKPVVEVWFEFASTYSYLAVSRVEAVAEASGVAIAWRPFLLGPIFRQKGWDTSPFVIDPAKGRYMWRDLERRAARRGLSFARPPIFPMNGLHAARIMTAALETPWCGAFARAVFAAQFAQGRDISDQAVLRGALEVSGADADVWIARSSTEKVRAALRARTETAAEIGVFGAPSFRVGDELFWGDDRLEDAVDWAVAHTEAWSSAGVGPARPGAQ